MSASPIKTHLWDDNPSEIDLLGFDAVVAPIVDAISSSDLDPLTIGVHARWGGGKSTILHLLASALESTDGVVVVQTSPWEYDDQDDVKGTLIADILDALRQQYGNVEGLKDRVEQLIKRISWTRVGKVVSRGILAHEVDFEALSQILKPQSRDSDKSMAGFKQEFGDLIDTLPEVDRVVVLVDDLDRCAPTATVATLEAIKLFLSVPGMVFVIAADQDMVRDAIAITLGGSVESSRYAKRYLDKIVQLPVSLPYLPLHEAEAYVGLLLSRSSLDDGNFKVLVDHANSRRLANKVPLLSEMGDLKEKPTDEVLRLATQLVHGLRSDKVVNPREIKRFLNAFQVRNRIALARGVVVRVDVLIKLLLLEDRFKLDFETLVNTPELERKLLLDAWSKWALDEGGSTKPEGVSEESKEWAAAEPDLTTENIGPYLTLAASFAITRQSGPPLDAELATLIQNLGGESEAMRRNALDGFVNRTEDDQRIAIEGLLAEARLNEDATRTISSLIDIAHRVPGLAQEVATGIKENCWSRIDAGNAVEIADSSATPLQALAAQLAADETVAPEVSQAARNVLEGKSG